MSAPWKPTWKRGKIRRVRTTWFGASQPRSTLPRYLRGAKRLRGLHEWRDPPRKRVQRRRIGSGALVLLGAAVAGIGAGAVLSLNEATRPVPVAKIETITPPIVMDDADREWSARGREQVGTATGSVHAAGGGVRAVFTYCKWGGGTNCVVDGDTFWIGGQKVRIADIDAPETARLPLPSELELGERAARQLQALLNSGAVTMTSIDRDRDVYGRLLRNVSVNGRDVGDALVVGRASRELMRVGGGVGAAEPPSRRDAIAKQSGASVERRRKPGRRVNERSEDNPFDVTDLLRDGSLHPTTFAWVADSCMTESSAFGL